MHQLLNYPYREYPTLFHDVQMAGIFSDSKYFADATPLLEPETLEKKYEDAKVLPGFDLLSFVKEHFSLPEEKTGGDSLSEGKSIDKHIKDLWSYLTILPEQVEKEAYSNLIKLPYPSIIPGGRFREMYYWDTYFTMLGLKESGEISLIENLVDNFAYLIQTFGFIPNGMRTYFLSRSQPPFFSLMVELLASIKGETIILKHLNALQQEYNFWMTGSRLVQLPSGLQLNRYWDDCPEPRPESYEEDVEMARESKRPAEELYRDLRAACESGWDFSARWLAVPDDLSSIRATQLLPVDLNCLLYHLEQTLAKAYDLQGNQPNAQLYSEKATSRLTAVQTLFWSESHHWFMDYDLETATLSQQFTLAGAFPLYFNLATKDQAGTSVETIKNEFLKKGGLVSTPSHSGQQWDAPNGWAPLQWITYKGLKNYELDDLAHKVATAWKTNVENVFSRSGKMVEKYNVENTDLEAGGGEYPNQDGFGWSNGVYLALASE